MPQNDVARLFLAVWPDAATSAQLAAYRDAWRWPPGARPVPDDKLHLTLHFIGIFERLRVAALAGALATIEPAHSVLRAGRPEVWRGGIAVLRLAADPHLSALHAALGDILRGEGIALDPRPFAPHVTLARRARGGAAPDEPPALAWPVRGFTLVESVRAPRARYHVIASFGGEAAPVPAG